MAGGSAGEGSTVCIRPRGACSQASPEPKIHAEAVRGPLATASERPVLPEAVGFQLWLLWLGQGIAKGKPGSSRII